MGEYIDECAGCKYGDSIDIVIHLGVCSHCKRAYADEDERDMHEDLYLKGGNHAGDHK